MGLSGSSTIIMIAVIVAALAAFIGIVFVAARRPYFRRPIPPDRPGPVRGGLHKGDPRSVAPHRDATVDPDQPSMRQSTAAPGDQAADRSRAGRR